MKLELVEIICCDLLVVDKTCSECKQKKQRDADQLILDRAEWLISYLIDVCQEWKTDYDKLDEELQDNANIHAGLMSVSNEAIKELEAKIEVLKQFDIRQRHDYQLFQQLPNPDKGEVK
jgi:hypothetical protein